MNRESIFKSINFLRNPWQIVENLYNKLSLLNNQNVKLEQRLQELEKKETYLYSVLKYLHYENSDTRSKLRYLLAEKIGDLPIYAKTYESFDYQWRNLSEGNHLLSDPLFLETCTKLICQYVQKDPSWFVGKHILDAGCGQGRFSFGFLQLGCDVTAIDQSLAGVEYAKNACKESHDRAKFYQMSLLEPLRLDKKFDLVWSFGVIHHTGNTFKAFKNITDLVKPGGYIFLMIYGEPKWGAEADFIGVTEYMRLRSMLQNKTYEEKINILLKEKPSEHLHGWFDAVSPQINDTYSFEEIEGWLLNAGFYNIRLSIDSSNHYIIAQKKD